MASIYKLNKSWAARLSYQENGKRKRLNKAGFSTKSAARAWATTQEAELQKHGGNHLSKQSIIGYYQEWFDTFKKPRVAPATQRRYMATKEVIVRYFGNRSLDSIDYADYQEFINKLASRHKLGTVKKVHGQVRAAIRKAFQMGKISADFTDGAEISGKPGKKPEDKFLDLDDMQRLLEYCLMNIKFITDVDRAMYICALLTGMRYEEVAGLTWDCVNFKKHTLKVNKAWDHVEHKFGPTKNESSMRTIKIDSQLVLMLKEWRQIVNEYMNRRHRSNPNNFVFLARSRGAVSPETVNHLLRKVYQQGIISKPITFHGLRHTHASYLISSGISTHYISERLGHKNTIVTETTYAHLFKKKRIEEENRAMKMLENLDKRKQKTSSEIHQK